MIVKKISWMMFASILLTIAMVLTITFWTAAQNNRSAAADSVKMVSGGLKGRTERIASLNYVRSGARVCRWI